MQVWVHPQLAKDIARWISPEMRVSMMDWNKERSQVQHPATESKVPLATDLEEAKQDEQLAVLPVSPGPNCMEDQLSACSEDDEERKHHSLNDATVTGLESGMYNSRQTSCNMQVAEQKGDMSVKRVELADDEITSDQTERRGSTENASVPVPQNKYMLLNITLKDLGPVRTFSDGYMIIADAYKHATGCKPRAAETFANKKSGERHVQKRRWKRKNGNPGRPIACAPFHVILEILSATPTELGARIRREMFEIIARASAGDEGLQHAIEQRRQNLPGQTRDVLMTGIEPQIGDAPRAPRNMHASKRKAELDLERDELALQRERAELVAYQNKVRLEAQERQRALQRKRAELVACQRALQQVNIEHAQRLLRSTVDMYKQMGMDECDVSWVKDFARQEFGHICENEAKEDYDIMEGAIREVIAGKGERELNQSRATAKSGDTERTEQKA